MGRKPARQILREEPATLDEDLAETHAALRLLTQSVVELLRLEQPALEEDCAQMWSRLFVEE